MKFRNFDYELKELKNRTDAQLKWYVRNSYRHLVNRRNEAIRILKERGFTENQIPCNKYVNTKNEEN